MDLRRWRRRPKMSVVPLISSTMLRSSCVSRAASSRLGSCDAAAFHLACPLHALLSS